VLDAAATPLAAAADVDTELFQAYPDHSIHPAVFVLFSLVLKFDLCSIKLAPFTLLQLIALPQDDEDSLTSTSPHIQHAEPDGEAMPAVESSLVVGGPATVRVFKCLVRDPKAWINKWRPVHLAADGVTASWAETAADAEASLAASASGPKGVVRISVVGGAAKCESGKVDGRQNIVRLKAADGSEVRGSSFQLVFINFTFGSLCSRSKMRLPETSR
jgi:hypothetical protein